MRPVPATAILLVSLLLPAPPASGHDWGSLAQEAPDAAELDAILAATEAIQAEALAGEAPPLAEDALAADWLSWLVGVAGLDRRSERDALADRLVAAGALAADERPLAPDAWRHALEHLALFWDARALGADRASAAEAEKRLGDPSLAPDEAVRLSYLAELGRGADLLEPPPDDLLERLGALLAAARRGGAGTR